MVKNLLLVLIVGVLINVGAKTIMSWDSMEQYKTGESETPNSNLILDLERERRGQYEYIYGYPKGNEHYGDTLVVDLSFENPEDSRWIEGNPEDEAQ